MDSSSSETRIRTPYLVVRYPYPPGIVVVRGFLCNRHHNVQVIQAVHQRGNDVEHARAVATQPGVSGQLDGAEVLQVLEQLLVLGVALEETVKGMRK